MSHDDSKPRTSGKSTVFLLAFLLIAISAFNYWAIAQQAELTRQSNKINHDALVSTQRAYLFVTETQVQTVEGGGTKQTQLIPKWENTGNTPANPVFFEARCPIMVEKNQEIPKKEMETPDGQQLQAPDRPIAKNKLALAPKQSTTGGFCIFSEQQLALLLPSKPHFYLTARAVYRDVFPGSPLRLTEYCSETIPVKTPDNKIIFQTKTCDNNNCIDDQCPEESRKEVEKEYGKI